MTEKRLNKFRKITGQRQKYLTIILENIHDAHNVSAVLRTADSVGIDKIYLVYNKETFPRISRISSASAKKWIEVVKFKSVKDCYTELKKERYNIYSTGMSTGKKSYSLYELNLTKRVALVFGNEHRGLSEEAVNLSDKNFLIPMKGMVQSLNVSVSAAVCLYEALRQREKKGMYEKSRYTKKELENKLNQYISK